MNALVKDLAIDPDPAPAVGALEIAPSAHTSRSPSLMAAARTIAKVLADGQALNRHILRDAMQAVFGGTDAQGAWTWKEAYNAAEIAELLTILDAPNRYAHTLPHGLTALQTLGSLQLTARMRTEDTIALQQFSTPLPLAYLTTIAAAPHLSDTLLEPSAGHGHLAVLPFIAGTRIVLNEYDKHRREALSAIFGTRATAHDAAQIHDRLADHVSPSLVVMNPPFASGIKTAANTNEAERHVASAFARLRDNGRLVAVVGERFAPDGVISAITSPLGETPATLLTDLTLERSTFSKRGTTATTRLIVIDKADRKHDAQVRTEPVDLGECRDVLRNLPKRLKAHPPRSATNRQTSTVRKTTRRRPIRISGTRHQGQAVSYSVREAEATTANGGLYAPYRVQRMNIDGAHPHPGKIVESTALASVTPPLPTYRPQLPPSCITKGLLSEAQLETVIYAGQAHDRHIDAYYTHDPETGNLVAASPETGFQLRQGFFIGDGTGVGKGRQVAGCIMDNMVQGRRRAIWISKNEELLEDAIRDWTGIGGHASEIFAQSATPYGNSLPHRDGILFTTFATIRGQARDERMTRLEQLIEWAGPDFDGILAFDEAHAMMNAITLEDDDDPKQVSLQAKAGLALQHQLPDARVLYVSATGASALENLAYADRLGLWRGADASFSSATDFVVRMSEGRVAAMEMICRDLKAQGLYCARGLSLEGVMVDPLMHPLTTEQTKIFDAYAQAFQVIHTNLEATLKAIGAIDVDDKTVNSSAVGAARSAFESTKQRFFRSLLTAMTIPSLLQSIEEDLSDDKSVLVQIVSTGEAVMERRLSQVTPEDLEHGTVDISPRDAVIDYLIAAYPTIVHEPITDTNGNDTTQIAMDEHGQPLRCAIAEATRDQLVEDIAALPPVHSALDQIIWHFGEDAVAEVTGRSRRIVRTQDELSERHIIQTRPGNAKAAETDAFMDGHKRILVFSEAGGTGRSYHADLTRENRQQRVHYLLEPGWRAEVAIQGLGRSNRTNQAHLPIFRPCATNVKGERRFLSTISRRLDSLGALTKGERNTGGQGMFNAEDNMESREAVSALTVFFRRIAYAPQAGISLEDFQTMTGLRVVTDQGKILENLPTIRRFLNRLLALPIDTQNILFEVFEELIANQVEIARKAGTLDLGAEDIAADEVKVISEHVIRTDPVTGAETRLLHIETTSAVAYPSFEEMNDKRDFLDAHFAKNTQSGRIALVTPATAFTDPETGKVERRVALDRPHGRALMDLTAFADSHWEPCSEGTAKALWNAETKMLPTHTVEEFGLVTGLISPIWRLLGYKDTTVYRVRMDEGASLLGRYVAPARIDPLMKALGLGGEATIRLTLDAMKRALRERDPIQLQDNAFIAKRSVMDVERTEICNPPADKRAELKALGCFTDIINYRTRVFIPTDTSHDRVLTAVYELLG